MRAPVIYRIAAGIAIVIVATPAAVYFLNSPAYRHAAGDPSTPKPVFRERLAQEQNAPTVLDQTTAPAGSAASPRADKKDGVADLAPPSPEQTIITRDEDRSGSGNANPSATGLGRVRNDDGAEGLMPDSEAKPVKPYVLYQPGPGAKFERGVAPSDLPVLLEAPGEQSAAARDQNRDKFEAAAPNPVKQVAAEPVSTFSIDVDTASYSFVRRMLNAGQLPPKDAVRVEEMINYFPYGYPRPESAETPFRPTVTVVPAPWKSTNKLVHIGIKGYDLNSAERPRANLVFLIDVSGSMASDDKLALVKNAFRLLVDELQPEDTVGIVTYASGSGVLLEPTQIAEKSKILAAVEALGAGGSTAGAEGIQDAYRLAEANFDKEGVNRIILATDGDFNVGVTDQDDLKGLIERKRASGIFLSILGVGQGNYNDTLMQTLAQNGNGTAAYVDTLNEARKVLVDEASSTLFTIAKDVKIQVEFNPAQISEYRLIGYETRALRREDFNN